MVSHTRSTARLAGLGALAFLVLVAGDNVIAAVTAPKNNATAAQLSTFLQEKGWTIDVLAVSFLLAMPSLFVFASGLGRRAVDRCPDAAVWADLGRCAVILIAALFGLVNAIQVAMFAARDTLAASPPTLTTLWALHNAVFTLNLIAIACALLGLGRAAALAGLVPARFSTAVYAGSAALALAAAPAVAEVRGSALIALGLAGFVVWLAFLGVIGFGLLRESAAAPGRDSDVGADGQVSLASTS